MPGAQERLAAAAAAVSGELAALEEGLQRRLAVAAARSILELMQDTAHVMSKVRLHGGATRLGAL